MDQESEFKSQHDTIFRLNVPTFVNETLKVLSCYISVIFRQNDKMEICLQ